MFFFNSKNNFYVIQHTKKAKQKTQSPCHIVYISIYVLLTAKNDKSAPLYNSNIFWFNLHAQN